MISINSERPRLIIVGASGQGLVVQDLLERKGQYEVMGFLDANKSAGQYHAGRPILGGEDSIGLLYDQYHFTHCLVAIGDNHVRRACVEKLERLCPQLIYPSVAHPSAVIAKTSSLAAGSIVMAGAIVGPGCVIGAHCVLNTRCSLDHESRMADFSSLAPGVTTGGNVVIGIGTAICMGASIVHGVRIGDWVVVGAQSLVLDDIKSRCMVYGIPARHIRDRAAADAYL